MTGYRIYLVDGGRQEFSADRCRHAGSRYVFERESPSGDWRTVHEVPVADVVQLQDGVPDPVPPHRAPGAHGHEHDPGEPGGAHLVTG